MCALVVFYGVYFIYEEVILHCFVVVIGIFSEGKTFLTGGVYNNIMQNFMLLTSYLAILDFFPFFAIVTCGLD